MQEAELRQQREEEEREEARMAAFEQTQAAFAAEEARRKAAKAAQEDLALTKFREAEAEAKERKRNRLNHHGQLAVAMSAAAHTSVEQPPAARAAPLTAAGEQIAARDATCIHII